MKPIKKLLESEVFSLIKEKNRTISGFQKLWSMSAPSKLSPLSHVGGIQNDILTIYVDNSGIASKLKFIESTLIKNLNDTIQKEMPHVSQIKSLKIKLNVKNSKITSMKPKKFPPQAKFAIEGLLSNLEDSPLKHCLMSLVKRHANNN